MRKDCSKEPITWYRLDEWVRRLFKLEEIVSNLKCCIVTKEVIITGTTQTILASSLGMSSIITVETLDENRNRAILEVNFNSARTEVTLAENPIINGVAIVTGYLV